jgi:hypothetical protein
VAEREPVIVCPYVLDDDVEAVRRAFRLDQPEGRRLPFFLWKDEALIGPELAYERCWDAFPDRDVIIMHSDMAPMPDDTDNHWYDELRRYARDLPQAGMLACDLLYPLQARDGSWLVQCAGGHFDEGKIAYVGGGVDVEHGTILEQAIAYGREHRRVRRAGWVTFGGVYIRREVLSACGPLDQRYQWAYVRDTDYCLEARSRGFELFQVPVTLRHSESHTMKALKLFSTENRRKTDENYRMFYAKWGAWLDANEPARDLALTR